VELSPAQVYREYPRQEPQYCRQTCGSPRRGTVRAFEAATEEGQAGTLSRGGFAVERTGAYRPTVDRSASCAARSNSSSSQGDTPLRPASTSRAHRM
jgi:hypothetical protein